MDDRAWVTAALRASDFMGCEYSFANNLAWRRLNNTRICNAEGFYVNRAEDETGPYYTFPAGEGDLRCVISALRDDANRVGRPLILTGVTKQTLEQMNRLFPDGFSATHSPDGDDYIYLASDLASLAGRAYHQKRNHLHRFAAYGAVYAPLTERDFDDCITLSARTYNLKNGQDDFSARMEQLVIHTFFTHFEALGLVGGTLRVDGQLVAFSIGEQLNSNTLDVHIEKADTAFEGAFTAINQAFVQHAAQGLTYVNREEDLGLEGLRKAKRSYRPVFMLEKYRLKQNGF